MMETSWMEGPLSICVSRKVSARIEQLGNLLEEKRTETDGFLSGLLVRAFLPRQNLDGFMIVLCGQWIFARFSKDFSWWRQCMLETQHCKASGNISCHRSSILWENTFACNLRCQTLKHSPGQGCSLHDIYGVTHIWYNWYWYNHRRCDCGILQGLLLPICSAA